MNTEIANKLILAEIDRQLPHWPMDNVNIQVKEIGGLVFGCFTASITNCSGMGRYGLYCINGLELFYSDSNVMDMNKLNRITINQAITQTTAYVTLISNKLQKVYENNI